MPRSLPGGQLPEWALRLDRNISALGVAQAERAVWREVGGKGRGQKPHWPPSQHTTVAGLFMILTPWGSLYLGRLPTHTLLNGSVLAQGHRGTRSIYGTTQSQECRLWRWQANARIPGQTFPV